MNTVNFQPYSGEKLERLIVEHIILTDQPFTIVEEESFLKLLLHGRPNAPHIVKADAIKSRIEKMFASEREHLIIKMEVCLVMKSQQLTSNLILILVLLECSWKGLSHSGWMEKHQSAKLSRNSCYLDIN